MIRFVDLRDQDVGYKFAFFDTIEDKFLKLGELKDEVFDDWKDLAEVCLIDLQPRLRCLCPSWVFEETKEDE